MTSIHGWISFRFDIIVQILSNKPIADWPLGNITQGYSGSGQQDGNDDRRSGNDHANKPAGVDGVPPGHLGVPPGHVLTQFGKFGIPSGTVLPHIRPQYLPAPVITLGYRVHAFLQHRKPAVKINGFCRFRHDRYNIFPVPIWQVVFAGLFLIFNKWFMRSPRNSNKETRIAHRFKQKTPIIFSLNAYE